MDSPVWENVKKSIKLANSLFFFSHTVVYFIRLCGWMKKMSPENETSLNVLRGSVTEAEILLLHQQVCYALGDPKRILLLYILREGPQSVGDLTDRMKLPQATISRHLRVLRERSLVRVEKRGTSNRYTMTDTRITDALDLLRQVLNQQLSDRAKLTAAIQCSYPPNEVFSDKE